jgi:rubrerythrin
MNKVKSEIAFDTYKVSYETDDFHNFIRMRKLVEKQAEEWTEPEMNSYYPVKVEEIKTVEKENSKPVEKPAALIDTTLFASSNGAKNGRWRLYSYDAKNDIYSYACSNCGYITNTPSVKCKNCGSVNKTI